MAGSWLKTIPSRIREDSRALLRILDTQIRQLDGELTQQDRKSVV